MPTTVEGRGVKRKGKRTKGLQYIGKYVEEKEAKFLLLFGLYSTVRMCSMLC